MSKIGILGSGQVAQILALGFKKHGHDVMIGSREPAKLTAWQAEKGAGIAVGDFAATARHAEVVVLAVLGRAAASALELAGHDNLAGKVVIDTTNPIDEKPPVNGVLVYFTAANESLMERLQKKVPSAKFVKAFSSVGNAFMVNPDFGGTRPTMFICGNDADAKATVSQLLHSVGWDSADMGAATAARPGPSSLRRLIDIPGARTRAPVHPCLERPFNASSSSRGAACGRLRSCADPEPHLGRGRAHHRRYRDRHRRPQSRGPAGRRRRPPVDLSFPRRGSRQHAGFRAGFSR